MIGMRKKKKPEVFDESLYKFAGEVTKALERNKDGTDQKAQVEELMEAEKKFKKFILKRRQTTHVYKRFVQKVCVQNRNILSARPYFRETGVSFSKNITPAIKAAMMGDMAGIEKLKEFDINFHFISYLKNTWLGPWPPEAESLFQRVKRARTVLIENNMPLAINRAKLFYRKTPKSHLSLMDMISICGQGLAAGIDKYVGAYTPVFRSVCIGRMVGSLIDSYSETMLHFYPSDKRVLYKAHSIRGRQGIDDINELTEAVINSFEQDHKDGKTIPKTEINVSELHSLMGAASMVSADSTVNDEGYGVYHFTEDPNQDMEKSLIERDSMDRMLSLAKSLPVLHRKVLRLKGVRL